MYDLEDWDQFGFVMDVGTAALTCPDCYALVSYGRIALSDRTPRWFVHYLQHHPTDE